MPIYNFRCTKCNHEFEDLVPKRGDISPCPKCGSKEVEKMISVPAKPLIKGSDSGSSCPSGTCNLPGM